jgi:hypothetical protein
MKEAMIVSDEASRRFCTFKAGPISETSSLSKL